MNTRTETADFAGGCFWGTEEAFLGKAGVTKTEVGYEGGHVPKPTYAMVCSHITGHAETVRATFDPKKISYRQLLELYMQSHDPTQLNRQGPDVGDSYRSAIFYQNEEQKQAAEVYIAELEAAHKYRDPIVTQVVPVTKFWLAEDYHQQYFAKQRGEA